MTVERKRRAAQDDTETGRLQSFSDGVFAVTITLLALNLVVSSLKGEPTAEALAGALAQGWPSYLAFVTSFGTILIMWVNHHAIVKLVRRADSLFVLANGLHLLHVTVVPFITVLVALGEERLPTHCLFKSNVSSYHRYIIARHMSER